MITAGGSGFAGQRVFEGHRIWRVSTGLLVRAVELIAAAERPCGPDLIVGIKRGGAPVAAALAGELGVPHALISARHNPGDEIAVQATGHVDVDLEGLDRDPDLRGKRVLLTDDICGSGSTIRVVTAALRPVLNPRLVRVAVLCRNAGSQVSPDSWVWDVSDWTVFPWEKRPGCLTELLPAPTEVRHP
jgi:uncharacterized protein